MAIDVDTTSVSCRKCGRRYGRMKGYFAVSYGDLYKGVGYLPYCKDCVDKMYNNYYNIIQNKKMAVRQMCRKLDIYWNQQIFDMAEAKSTTKTIMTSYLAKVTATRYAGKSYDDTLKEEGKLWESVGIEDNGTNSQINSNGTIEEITLQNIPEDVKAFWGTGYTADMYMALEQRKNYWMSEFPEGYKFDIGTKILIKQICALELDINRDRAAGKSADKNINTLNTLLGSLNIKPVQQKADEASSGLDSTPLGVWLYRYENEKPLPEIDDDLKDVNGLKKYIFTWFGHVCKMLGVKNTYTKLYEEEIARLRVEKPEYDDDDDETLLINSYS